MADEHSLMMNVSLAAQDVEPALAEFQAAVAAMPFTSAKVTHEAGTLYVEGRFVDKDQTDELMDLVIAAMGDAFPVLNEEPIDFDDPILGTFSYRDDLGGFERSIQLGEHANVALLIESPSETVPPEALTRAHDIVRGWHQWGGLVSKRIIDELLTLYNETWRPLAEDANAGPLTADRFLNRLAICYVTVQKDWTVEIRYTADGMFTEHGVAASISPDGEIEAWME